MTKEKAMIRLTIRMPETLKEMLRAEADKKRYELKSNNNHGGTEYGNKEK